MERNSEFSHVVKLVEGRTQGGVEAHGLPAEVSEAVETARLLEQRYAAASAATVAVDESAVVEQLVEQAAAGELTDKPLAAWHAGQERQQRGREEARLLGLAVEQARRGAVTATLDDAERILLEHLRPPYQAVITRAAELAPLVRGLDLTAARSVMAASAEEQAAAGELQELSDRRVGLRTARVWLARLGYAPLRDTEGLFSELRDPKRAWGVSWARRLQYSDAPPWPREPLPFLLWAVTSGHPLWLPTPSEQDAAFNALVAEQRPELARQTAGVAIGSARGVELPTRQ